MPGISLIILVRFCLSITLSHFIMIIMLIITIRIHGTCFPLSFILFLQRFMIDFELLLKINLYVNKISKFPLTRQYLNLNH